MFTCVPHNTFFSYGRELSWYVPLLFVGRQIPSLCWSDSVACYVGLWYLHQIYLQSARTHVIQACQHSIWNPAVYF